MYVASLHYNAALFKIEHYRITSMSILLGYDAPIDVDEARSKRNRRIEQILNVSRCAQLFLFPSFMLPLLRKCGPGPIQDCSWQSRNPERRTSVLLLILVLLLLFGGGGGYYGYSRWGRGGGLGIVGTVVLIAVILYFLGGLR